MQVNTVRAIAVSSNKYAKLQHSIRFFHTSCNKNVGQIKPNPYGLFHSCVERPDKILSYIKGHEKLFQGETVREILLWEECGYVRMRGEICITGARNMQEMGRTSVLKPLCYAGIPELLFWPMPYFHSLTMACRVASIPHVCENPECGDIMGFVLRGLEAWDWEQKFWVLFPLAAKFSLAGSLFLAENITILGGVLQFVETRLKMTAMGKQLKTSANYHPCLMCLCRVKGCKGLASWNLFPRCIAVFVVDFVAMKQQGVWV